MNLGDLVPWSRKDRSLLATQKNPAGPLEIRPTRFSFFADLDTHQRR